MTAKESTLPSDSFHVIVTSPLVNHNIRTFTAFVITHESVAVIAGAVISAFIVGTRVFTAALICFGTFVYV